MDKAPVRVLIVEDDTDDFLIIKVMLSGIKNRRFELDRVSTYQEAMKKMETGAHDVCLLDYRLQGKTGIDFLKETKQKGYHIPIIFLTGQGDYEVDVEAMQLGAAEFLYKNRIDSTLLERSIRYALERKKVEDALRHREEFFRAVVENAMDGVSIIRMDGEAEYVSPSIEKILGYKPWEVKEMGMMSFMHHDDAPRLQETFQDLFKTPGKTQALEARARHNDGSWRILEATAKSHLFPYLPQPAVVFNYRDITHRKKAEEATSRLATIVEYSNDAIVGCDLNGIITHWNHGAEVIYGYTEKEAIGRPMTMVLTPGNIDENKRQIELIKHGGSIHHFESVRQKKGGQVVDVSVSVSPFKDADGKITGISAIVRDITERKKSIETISRLASVVESSNDAIYTISLEGVILSWNPGAQRIYGYSPSEIGGRDWSVVIPPNRRGEIPGLLEKIRKGKAVTDFVTTHESKKGRELLLSVSLSPIKDTLGQVARASVIARDITESERVKAIRDTLESERDQLLERLQLQMERMPIACVLTDPHFHYTYWNPAAEEMFGYSFKEVEGKTGLLAPPSVDLELKQQFGAIIRERVPVRKVLENIRKDGKAITCEWYITPLYDLEGTFNGMMSMALDVSERRKAEGVQSQLASILQQTPDAVIGSDLDGRIYSWNKGAETMFGYTLEEAAGQPVTLLAPGDRKEETVQILDEVLKGEILSNFETVRLRKDGSLFDVAITLSPIQDSKGKVIGVSAILRDITERKKAEESLRRHEEQLRLAQKMDAIGRLAGGVAHDFNNLLSVIGGNTEFLLGSLAEKDPHREELEEIQKAVKRGAELTKQLLVFGQKQVSQPQPVNLNDLSGEMSKMLKRLIDATIDLAIIQDKGLKSVLADPGQMQQIILNLVLNARDAMPKGGNLILETRNIEAGQVEAEGRAALPPGSYARLSVTDTGIGMVPEVQKHIFEPFFTTKAGKGTGLGLATVYGLVNKWQGFIFVHSTPGMGSTFSLYFPSMEKAGVEPAKAKQMALIPQGSETVLVAEDEEPVRKILVRTLEKYGYSILEAPNGIAALQKAWGYREPIHLLLTDTVMPKMNGKELADELKKTRPRIKVVFISGYPKEILSQQGVLDSGIHLIQKPFDLEDLARQVRKILDEK